MPTSQIQQRQIVDGAINDAKVAAGAAIATSKLADGVNFVKRDGSIAMTGNLNLGSQRITSLQTPSASTDAATKAYVDTAVSNVTGIGTSMPAARCSPVGNADVNYGIFDYDGVTVANGDILFINEQTAPADNGLYTYNGYATAMTRIPQMNAWIEVPGALATVAEGTTKGNTLWMCTSNTGGTIGTTAIVWAAMNPVSGLSSANFVDKEIPSGSINGSNTSYTLAFNPTSNSEHVYLNGVLQESGAGNDYTISGAGVVMLTAPLSGEKIRVSYRK